MSENGTTTRRPTIGQVARMVRIFGGTLHGDDVRGVVDIWWASGDLRRALEFAAVADGLDWAVDFRDAVKCIHDAAVLQVWAQPRDRSEFEPDRYPADRVAPQPVDESLPRNCPTCGTVDWWAQSGSQADVIARRESWHDCGHPESRTAEWVRQPGLRAAEVDAGEIVMREELRIEDDAWHASRRPVQPRNCTTGTCGNCTKCYPGPERGSAEYNQNLLQQWGI